MPGWLFNPPVIKELEKSKKRGKQLLEATMAINEGRAEAFPPAVSAGMYGPIGGVSKSAARAASTTFAESLMRTWEARNKHRKNKRSRFYEIDKGLEAAGIEE